MKLEPKFKAMKTRKSLLKVMVSLLILIPLCLNSCEKEERHRWCVSCYGPSYWQFFPVCFDNLKDAQDYKANMINSDRDITDCSID